jgi:hypothetical protein
LPVDKCHRGWRFAQSKPFNHLFQLRGNVRGCPRSLRPRRASPTKPSRRYWARHRCTVRNAIP